MTKQKLVSFFFEKNFMISPDILKKIPDDFDYEDFLKNNCSMGRCVNTMLLTEELFHSFLPKLNVILEDDIITKVEVIDPYVDLPKKREVKDFVGYMKVRYNSLRKILLQRNELSTAISISKISSKKAKEPVSIIGFVFKIEQTKNGNYIMEIEDPTGVVKVLIPARNQELLDIVPEIVLDEVIGIVGTMGEGLVYVKNIMFPDMPVKEFKRTKDDISVAFISDLHVGSKLFAKEEFGKFIDWLNLEYGNNEQKELAKKVKYLIISGDLIDGIGIYPGQDKELEIKDVYEQYNFLAEYFLNLRKDIKVIICGGNHDALRLSEPQPLISPIFAKSFYQMKNVTLVNNPAFVRIHGIFDILMYHGSCFDYYVNNIDFLRKAGSYDAVDKMMEFVLKKRHLAPTHISTLYIPDINKDPLVIDKVPDFFVTGHTHHDVKISSYKNVTLIGCSSFQYKTTYQEKLGHTNIICARIPVINLKSRQIKIMDFRKDEELIKEIN